MKKTLFACSALALLATAALADPPPAQNIDSWRHGNLSQAQQLSAQAYQKLSEAQFDNHSELGGHAARAKELLREANDEMKAAAEFANWRH